MSGKQEFDQLKRELCAESGPEDGTDPRDFHARNKPRHPNNRKALQLSAQVQRALYWALGSVCDDPVLQRLAIISVEPAPNASRLLVTFMIAAHEESDVDSVMERLSRAYGLLRSEVAREINRRKVPELIFRVIG